MRTVAWKKLSPEAFSKFGAYASMIDPSGPHLGAEPIEFYRDMVQSQLGTTPVASFGVCRVVKRPLILDVSEYHDTCCEIVLPLDGNVLMHVAPAVPQKEFPFDQVEVFFVPRGTICCLRPGVWHHAPFALETRVVNCLIALPERTYMNDCKVYEFPKDRFLHVSTEGLD
ncbi:MAG TPA: ureidoglycolate lyase [Spirochaetia bacterium]|nr:ureidoglycolate lyase [Spirochaetia bacterium]